MGVSPSSSGGSDASGRGSSTWPVAACVLAVLVPFVAVFWPFLRRQVEWAFIEQADWGHTLVIPAIAVYFVYAKREALREAGFRTTWVAFVPILAGLGWFMLCMVGPQVLGHHNLHGAGVGLTLAGLVLLFTGWRAMRILWFPILYLVVFGQSISYRLLEKVTYRMQDIAARGSELVLYLTGLDVERTGNTLYVYFAGATEPHPLNIAEACSGMRMLMAFLALGVAMAYLGLHRWWQQVLLVAMAVPVAIVVNILRVVTLAWLTKFDTGFAAGDFHTFVGMVWLIPAFVMYLGLRWVIEHLVREEPPAAVGAGGGGGSNV